MTMEYVEGMNLRDFLKLRTRLDTKAALPLILGLARGLKYSHSQGVTHRDMKGTNILISNSGAAKLVDFGLATIESDDKKTTMRSQRTVDYSALERTCGSQKGDPRSDIYFLGCVFYQMLTGQLPMKEVESKDMLEKMLKRSFGAIKPLSDHPYAPDEELSRIIEKMMKVELRLALPVDRRRGRRPRSLRDASEVARPPLAGRARTSSPTSSYGRSSRKSRPPPPLPRRLRSRSKSLLCVESHGETRRSSARRSRRWATASSS